jgi:hypothetical protein
MTIIFPEVNCRFVCCSAAEELGGVYGASKALIWVSRVLGVLPAHRLVMYVCNCRFVCRSAAEELGGVYGASRALIWVSRALGVLPAQAARVSQVVAEPSQPYQPNRGTRVYR